MIGRHIPTRIASAPPRRGGYEPAALHGLGGGFVPVGLGATQPPAIPCPSCGAQVPLGGAAAAAASGGGASFGAAMVGSVTTMTLAGLLTQMVSKRLLGW